MARRRGRRARLPGQCCFPRPARDAPRRWCGTADLRDREARAARRSSQPAPRVPQRFPVTGLECFSRHICAGLAGARGARGAGRQKGAPPAGARGAAKLRGRWDAKQPCDLMVSNPHSRALSKLALPKLTCGHLIKEKERVYSNSHTNTKILKYILLKKGRSGARGAGR